jgi:hypothetical protein
MDRYWRNDFVDAGEPGADGREHELGFALFDQIVRIGAFFMADAAALGESLAGDDAVGEAGFGLDRDGDVRLVHYSRLGAEEGDTHGQAFEEFAKHVGARDAVADALVAVHIVLVGDAVDPFRS